MLSSTFLDEVGYLAYDARAADLLFQLVSRRYEHRSLLITTNLPFKRWDTVRARQHLGCVIVLDSAGLG